MDVVSLHHARDAVRALEDEGDHGDLVFGGERGVVAVELAHVVGPVAGWERDAGEGDLSAAILQATEDGVEVGASVGYGKTAETVVAAKLDDDEGGMHVEDAADAGEAVFCGVAADAFVDDAIFVTGVVQISLEDVGIALAGFGAVAGGEGVAEADELGPVIGGDGGIRRVGGGVGGGGKDGRGVGFTGGHLIGGLRRHGLIGAAALRCARAR